MYYKSFTAGEEECFARDVITPETYSVCYSASYWRHCSSVDLNKGIEARQHVVITYIITAHLPVLLTPAYLIASGQLTRIPEPVYTS